MYTFYEGTDAGWIQVGKGTELTNLKKLVSRYKLKHHTYLATKAGSYDRFYIENGNF